MNRPQSHIVPLVVIALLLVGASHVRSLPGAQPLISNEPKLKADVVALLPKLVRTKYISWPAAPTGAATITIGVLGTDPFQQGADNHLDRNLANQNVVVLRFANIANYKACHILVVSRETKLQPALDKTDGESVLVVTELPGLAKKGAVINLVVDPEINRLVMEISPDAASRAGLTIDPRVYRLSMVRIVR
jgi:hypothetical protein